MEISDQTNFEKEVEESQIAAENRFLKQLNSNYENEINKLVQKCKFLEEQSVKHREKVRQFDKLISELKKVSDRKIYSTSFNDLTFLRTEAYNKEYTQLEKIQKKLIYYKSLTKQQETAEELNNMAETLAQCPDLYTRF